MNSTDHLRTALAHLETGDWQAAHPIAQEDSTPLGAWAHGIVHILEGDYRNARYWYGRAGRVYPGSESASETVKNEIAALKAALRD